MTTVAVPLHGKLGEGFSRREQVEALVHPGRQTDGRQSAASWVTDLGDLRKVVLLCGWCAPKFNPRRHHYRRMYVPDYSGVTSGYTANGMCDACKTQTALTPGGGTAYVAEETYAQVCQDPADARRRARLMGRGGASVWTAVQASIRRAWGGARPIEAGAQEPRS